MRGPHLIDVSIQPKIFSSLLYVGMQMENNQSHAQHNFKTISRFGGVSVSLKTLGGYCTYIDPTNQTGKDKVLLTCKPGNVLYYNSPLPSHSHSFSLFIHRLPPGKTSGIFKFPKIFCFLCWKEKVRDSFASIHARVFTTTCPGIWKRKTKNQGLIVSL